MQRRKAERAAPGSRSAQPKHEGAFLPSGLRSCSPSCCWSLPWRACWQSPALQPPQAAAGGGGSLLPPLAPAGRLRSPWLRSCCFCIPLDQPLIFRVRPAQCVAPVL